MNIENFISPEIHNFDLWLSEAKFGFSEIDLYCRSIPKGSNVLEVGSGSGILLSFLSNSFQDLKFHGIEPFGKGFVHLKGINNFIKKQDINITNISFDNFSSDIKFDLIFSINVFEHVDNWSNFIMKAEKLLTPSGKLIILCPNYGFPFESHFSIPIIFNKKLTALIFKKRIEIFEKINECEGLWDSLNFVKKSQIIKEVRNSDIKSKLKLIDHKSIINTMAFRSLKDVEFKKRHPIIAFFAKFLIRVKFFEFLKIFPNILPYMKLEFIKI